MDVLLDPRNRIYWCARQGSYSLFPFSHTRQNYNFFSFVSFFPILPCPCPFPLNGGSAVGWAGLEFSLGVGGGLGLGLAMGGGVRQARCFGGDFWGGEGDDGSNSRSFESVLPVMCGWAWMGARERGRGPNG